MKRTGGGKRTEVRGRLRGQKQEDEGENTTQRGERLERGVSTWERRGEEGESVRGDGSMGARQNEGWETEEEGEGVCSVSGSC